MNAPSLEARVAALEAQPDLSAPLHALAGQVQGLADEGPGDVLTLTSSGAPGSLTEIDGGTPSETGSASIDGGSP